MSADLRGTKVLVSGGAGFIGSHTVDVLLRSGADVVVVDDLSTGRRENLDPRATLHQINVADEAFERLIESERPQVIYHLAYFVSVPASVDNPLLDVDLLVGSLRMLRKARELGVRKIVFASSGFLYGNTLSRPATEQSAVAAVSPYAVSKRAIEGYLEFFRTAFGLSSVVLRYATVYGPRQVNGALADYIRQLSAGRQAEMWGDGNKTRDYIYIDDVVKANMLALALPDDHPDPVFNIGTGVETTLNALYRTIADSLGVDPKPIYHSDRPGEFMKYCLDSTKAKASLGWEPQVDLRTGLEQTLRASGLPLGRRRHSGSGI